VYVATGAPPASVVVEEVDPLPGFPPPGEPGCPEDPGLLGLPGLPGCPELSKLMDPAAGGIDPEVDARPELVGNPPGDAFPVGPPRGAMEIDALSLTPVGMDELGLL
jgi:hypothetical protein